jgi:transcriptional regulator with XRE-family HTH domain
MPGVPLTLKALRKRTILKAPEPSESASRNDWRELGLLQREAVARMGIIKKTCASWEKGKTEPVASQYRPVVAFLGSDPSPVPMTLAERVEGKRRATGLSFEQVAGYLGWDPATLTRYLNGTWRIPANRTMALELLLPAKTTVLTESHRLPGRSRRSGRSAST